MRIIYIGCVQSSYILLEHLLKNGANIVGVITKSTSKFNADFKNLEPLCLKYNLPYYCCDNINDNLVIEFIKQCSPDVGFCFGWSQLIKKDVINLFSKGIIGAHPAKLPNNRGRHPIIWALALGLTSTASSFFIMDEKADTGGIVSQIDIDISYEDNAKSLMSKVIEVSKQQVLDIWKDLINNNVKIIKQDDCIGNSWRKRGILDGQIDWRMSSRNIYNLVRALTKPYVGAHFMYKGQEIKVWDVQEFITFEYHNIEPGKIIKADNGKYYIKTGDNLIVLIDFDDIVLSEGEYL